MPVKMSTKRQFKIDTVNDLKCYLICTHTYICKNYMKRCQQKKASQPHTVNWCAVRSAQRHIHHIQGHLQMFTIQTTTTEKKYMVIGYEHAFFVVIIYSHSLCMIITVIVISIRQSFCEIKSTHRHGVNYTRLLLLLHYDCHLLLDKFSVESFQKMSFMLFVSIVHNLWFDDL